MMDNELQPSVLVVLTNLPDRDLAERLASELVERRLAACVNILPACTSVYRWESAIETEEEVPMLIKTTHERYPEVERAIIASHPYTLPEVIAIPVRSGLSGYLAWIAAEVSAE